MRLRALDPTLGVLVRHGGAARGLPTTIDPNEHGQGFLCRVKGRPDADAETVIAVDALNVVFAPHVGVDGGCSGFVLGAVWAESVCMNGLVGCGGGQRLGLLETIFTKSGLCIGDTQEVPRQRCAGVDGAMN